MSYIICSNQQRDYKDSNTGLQDPNTFKNFFKSPLIVEPNSEIAVESVKFTRAGVYQVKDNSLFYLYFGKELTAETQDLAGVVTPAYAQPDTPRTSVPIYLKKGVYTPREMGQHLQTQINLHPVHPQYFGRCVVTTKFDSDKDFIGFQFQFSCIGTGSDSHANYGAITEGDGEIAGTEASEYGATAGYTWTNSPLKFTCGTHDGDEASCSVLTRNPMSSGSTANGRSIFEVKIQYNAGTFLEDDIRWRVGLSRATIGAIGNGAPPMTETHGQPFYDYGVEYDDDKGGIFVFEYNTGDFPGARQQLRKRDINYFAGAGDFTSRITQTNINASTLNSIRFVLQGDQVKCEIGTNGGTFYDLVNFNNAKLSKTRESNFKPLNNNTEALYPKFEFGGDRDAKCTMEVMAFQTLYPVAEFGKFNYPTLGLSGQMLHGSDFFSSYNKQSSDKRDSAGKNYTALTDNRPATQANDITNASTPFAYVGNNGSGMVDYKHVIVQGTERGQSNVTDPTNIAYTLQGAGGATMVNNLGFGDIAVIEQSEFGSLVANDDRHVQFVPDQTPELLGGSLFVRVPNLEQISYNGGTNSISKILYHIPAFDTSGRNSGPLFHAPNEKTYVKLNNVERLTIPELSLDIVGRQEKITNELVDNTTICLHIRKSRL